MYTLLLLFLLWYDSLIREIFNDIDKNWYAVITFILFLLGMGGAIFLDKYEPTKSQRELDKAFEAEFKPDLFNG